MAKIKLVVLFISVFFMNTISAQINPQYTFQNLSGTYYKSQADSLKKNIKAPNKYAKATQKKYEEIWDERLANIYGGIYNNNYVYSSEINSYLSSILKDIAKKNSQYLPNDILLMLDRSADINAYTSGLNIVSVNAGLLEFINSREELAFILAHELAHNYLKHTDNAIEKSAEWLTSDEYTASLKDIHNAKYEKFSLLKKMAQNYSFDRKRHSRLSETNADSFAIVLLKNANMPFNAKWLLRLDSADAHYKKQLKNDIPDYFKNYGIDINSNLLVKKGRGLSTKNYNFQDSIITVIQDSLKTHPDCEKRYELTKKWSSTNFQEHAIPTSIVKEAKKIIIFDLFNDLNLTACLYRLFLDKDNGITDAWYDFMLHDVFFGLWYATNDLNRFNAIKIKPKEYISKSYYQMQTMLEQLTMEEIEKIYNDLAKANFWQQMPADAKAVKDLMQNINTAKKQKSITGASKEYIANHPNSIYCEFANSVK